MLALATAYRLQCVNKLIWEDAQWADSAGGEGTAICCARPWHLRLTPDNTPVGSGGPTSQPPPHRAPMDPGGPPLQHPVSMQSPDGRRPGPNGRPEPAQPGVYGAKTRY